jgi:ubiquinol-cytochrome c reductase iron-sulfur subunit
MIDIVHAGAAQALIRKRETARLDQVNAHGKTGGKPQDSADIAGDFRLVKGNPHDKTLKRNQGDFASFGPRSVFALSRGTFSLFASGANGAKGVALNQDVRVVAIMAASDTVEADSTVETPKGDVPVRRRDFINIAAISFAGVGAGVIVLPLVNQMNPSADVLAEASIEVDVSAIAEGQAIKTIFRKQPLFVRHLTKAEIAEANKVNISELRDAQTLAERTKEGHSQWLITMGVCTHLGCVPLGASTGEVKGEYGGYFCPCHGSHYDTAGRVRKGPAPTNLMVPEYAFTSDTVVQVG